MWLLHSNDVVTTQQPRGYCAATVLTKQQCYVLLDVLHVLVKEITCYAPKSSVNPLFSSPDTSLIDCRVSFRPTSTLSRDGCSGIGGMSVQTIAGTGSSLCSLPESKSNLEV